MEILSEEIEDHGASDADWTPLPFKKFLETLSLEKDADSDDSTLLDPAIISCKKDLVNSGRTWNLRNSLLFSQKEQDPDVTNAEIPDPFVENLILERLAVQTPMRVLFDVVPGIKFQDAIKLIGMQPLPSTTSAWKRIHDIELMHMRYALQSVALALGEMEKCSGDGTECHYHKAVSYLREMQNFMEAINSSPRKIFMVSIVLSLLHMDECVKLSQVVPSECSSTHECHDGSNESEGKNMVTSFVGLLLDILRHNLLLKGADMDHLSSTGLSPAGGQAVEWRLKHAQSSIEDLGWRLSVLRRLPPLAERQWSWKEALVLLRAAPSKLLNVCMQRANYDIGEEAVQRFSLPAEDKASLELAEWVAGAYKRALVEDAVNRVTDNTNSTQELDILSFHAQLGSLTTILLCIDVAATSAKSGDMCRFLLGEATRLLSEIFPGSSPKIGSGYWDQIQEVAIISVIKRILQRLHDIVDLEVHPHLQLVFAEMGITLSTESSRVGQKQRPLGLLHQMIDDAFKGKRQFLSGKLHNVARAIVDEDTDCVYLKDGVKLEKKDALSSEKNIVLGYGLRILKQASGSDLAASNVLESSSENKGSANRYLSPVSTKPSTYLSNFIIYIATIGDIVDGTDTTHDFNYFSLVYEWPKDDLFGRAYAYARNSFGSGLSIKPAYPAYLDYLAYPVKLFGKTAYPNGLSRGFVKDATQAPEIERSFYEFALEQSERYPTLNRWIQMQSNLHRVSESSVTAKTGNNVSLNQSKGKFSMKRAREPDSDAESEFEDIVISGKTTSSSLESPKHEDSKLEPTSFISFDWENEGPYEKAVERYLRSWDLDAANNVLTMCICHLFENDPLRSKVLHMKQSLKRYGHIMSADDRYTRWQEVEVDCEDDPEGLALRLAAKGAVSAALEVAESASLSIDLRRELQGRQLVKLLTTDPLNGGGPAAASRFLSSLRDSNDALPVAIGAMKLLPDLRSKQLLVHFFLKRTVGNLSDTEVAQLNSWALGKERVQVQEVIDLHGKLCLVCRRKGHQFILLRGQERLPFVSAPEEWVLTGDPVKDDATRSCHRYETSPDITLFKALLSLCSDESVAGKGSQYLDELLSDLLGQADTWLGRAELLQSLLGSGILASLDDIADKESAISLRDRLVSDERYSMAVYTCKKCKIDTFPVWVAWGHALVRTEHYAQARVKFKQALQQYKSDATSVVIDIINTIEGGPPVDVSSVRSMLINEGKLDDALAVSDRCLRNGASDKLLHLLIEQKEERSLVSGQAHTHGSRNFGSDTWQHCLRLRDKKLASQLALKYLRSWDLDAANNVLTMCICHLSENDKLRSKVLHMKQSLKRYGHIMSADDRYTRWQEVEVDCEDDPEGLALRLAAKGAVSAALEVAESASLSIDLRRELQGRQLVKLLTTDPLNGGGPAAASRFLSSLRDSNDALPVAIGAMKLLPDLRSKQLLVHFFLKRTVGNLSDTEVARLNSWALGNLDYPSLGQEQNQKSQQTPAKTNFVQSLGNFQREARKAFSWLPRDSGTKTPSKDVLRKRKSSGSGGDRSSWEAMPGVQEERTPVYPSEGQERLPFVSAPEEWVLTGDPVKDDATRIAFICVLMKSVAGKGALELCISQMKVVLSSQQLPLDASMDNIARAYNATETYVQALSYAKNLLKKNTGSNDLTSSSERSRDVDGSSADTGSSSAGSQYLDELSDLLGQADTWLGRAELLQSLLGSGILASLDDIADKESAISLRDRLVSDERYSMAVYTCKKCKIDAFPVWVAWGHALVRTEHYAQARVKFKQALQQYKSDATSVVIDIINTIEGGPPVDVSSVRSMYEHLAKSAVTIFDDSLSADAYLNVLYMPSTFPRSERSGQSRDSIASQIVSAGSYPEDGPRSNLDSVRYAECIHYLQEVLKGDHVASGRCCIQLFMNSMSQDEALRHLGHAKMDVVKALNSTDGPQWKTSLFGNPTDPETMRRRCIVVETLAEKHFDLAFRMLHEFDLPAADIYAGVAASLAERKKGGQLTEFLKNIRGTIDEDEWDQVLGAAINVYANKHKERPDRLIDMLISNHRKVLACVVCGRLKSAFQIASRSGSVADVQYVAHQALHANALPVLDMCKQWLAQYM
ncbi:hypothetical protein PR202_ga10633 [Eleusine coracana subsp. coracana]|uniref:ZFYVE26-like TPR repeats domain-containing protein n=1 Tax=Eleusine coracana subsp. coracana TaxID=191504 RepID=A0AAV5C7D2_ELECO|nr:hypothetical protein PR202_ga10633 [Eleusine coracana subsp. coracana]